MERQTTRVLLIDDDADVRDTMEWLLEDAGFAVSVAANGHEGLVLQRRQPADVVVTDIFMPEQDGIETLWHFRGEFPNVPIVVVSGALAGRGTDYSVVTQELGAAKTLQKPFDPQELIKIVRELSRSLS